MNPDSGAEEHEHERMRQEAVKMLLGKRPRPSPTMITRTTSMGGIVVHDDDDDDIDHHQLAMHTTAPHHFLRTCALCKRVLPPARDIYMYRGDIAFCSLECREKHMRQEERKEKRNKVVASTNKQVHHSVSPPPI